MDGQPEVFRARPQMQVVWRRANRGWERADQWTSDRHQRPGWRGTAPVHPLAVALIELLFCLMVLIVYSPAEPESRPER